MTTLSMFENIPVLNALKFDIHPKTHKLPFIEKYWPESVKCGKYSFMLGEEINYKFKQACIAEFIAMVFFVVICCGCAMVSLCTDNALFSFYYH